MFNLDVFRRHFAKLAQSKILQRELTCNRKYDYVISSNEVCKPIPVTFSKFGSYRKTSHSRYYDKVM